MYIVVATAEQWAGNKKESTVAQTQHEPVEVAFLGCIGIRCPGIPGKREMKLTQESGKILS